MLVMVMVLVGHVRRELMLVMVVLVLVVMVVVGWAGGAPEEVLVVVVVGVGAGWPHRHWRRVHRGARRHRPEVVGVRRVSVGRQMDAAPHPPLRHTPARAM